MGRSVLGLTALAVLGAAILASTPAQAGMASIKPSGPWSVELVGDRCRLMRPFGDDSARHLLVFEQYWPDAKPGLYVAGPDFEALDRDKPFGLKFREGQTENARIPYNNTIEGYGAAYFYPFIDLAVEDSPPPDPTPVATHFPRLDTELAGRLQFVAMRFGEDEVRLVTGSMRNAFAVLNECTQNIVLNWGLDLKQQLGATRMPYLVNEKMISKAVSDHMPFERLASGELGIVRVRLLISETGAITDCKVIVAPDRTYLEQPVCRGFRRAKFEPARDAAGNSMPSFYATTITFALG